MRWFSLNSRIFIQITITLLLSIGQSKIWPKPNFQVSYHNNGIMLIPARSFRFKVLVNTCDILEAALKRYHTYLLLERTADYLGRLDYKSSVNFRGNLTILGVALMAPCEDSPYFGMDEHYELRIDSEDVPEAGKLVANSVWGILRGLETFVQLAVPSEGDEAHLLISSCLVSDFPRYSHRGLMIDTSRHFLPLFTLFTLIDGMEASKLNVLHWHMTDDAAFPFRSARFPEFSEKGAFHPYTHVYTLNDVISVVEYCRLRGIRVIPEFDTPGHCRSWGQFFPHLLTKCYDENGVADGTLGPMDPTSQFSYDIVKGLLAEVSQVFIDSHMYLGGDDIQLGCWESNPAINQYLEENGLAGDHRILEGVYMDQVAYFVTVSLERQIIVWQDLFDNGAASLELETVVQVTKAEGFQEVLQNITEKGHLALLSSCWHLDNLESKWDDMYNCEPGYFVGGQPGRVIGGEATMWTHYADHTNIVSRVFPRVSAMAERLWSSSHSLDAVEATARMDRFRCLLLRRGVDAEPSIGPGFCLSETFHN